MNPLTARLRRRVSRVLRSSKPFRDMGKRVDDVDQRQRRLEREVARSDQRRGRQQDEQRAALERLTGIAGRGRGAALTPVERAEDLRQVDHQRLLTQVAVYEERLARLEDAAGPQPTEVGGDLGEARTLLEEIRTEHAQVRARMQVIAWYEERLRRVESGVASVYDGDKRHPV